MISSGLMTMRALEAAKALSDDRVEVAVLHVPTIKPLDAETIRREAGRLFDLQVVNVFLSIPAETWSTIAGDQRTTAVLPSLLRQDNAIRRRGAGVIL